MNVTHRVPNEEPDQSDRLPKIAFFTPDLAYGGAQKVTINIVNVLASRGHDVDLVAAHLEGEFVSELDDAVRCIDLDIPRISALGVLAGIPELRRYIKTEEPCVLIASRTHANIASVAANTLTGTDTFVAATEHSAFGSDESLRDTVTTALASLLYHFVDDVVTVSEGVAESVVSKARISDRKTTVLNNPVDIEAIQERATEPIYHQWFDDPDVRTLVTVGRLEAQKDHETLLRAFEQVHEANPQTRLIVVGKGSERDRLETLAESLGIDDVVSFAGYVDNPYAYMRQSDVFVLSSKYEGLPTVLIEALACGCPIVSTDCPHGPREVLADGNYGWLSPVDDPEALAASIETALDDPIQPEEATSRAEHFSMDAGADRYEAYVRNVVESGR